MKKLNELALRRSIYFPSAEIYANSPSGFWDFGPIGTRIKRKIVEFWRKELVQKEGFYEMFGTNILPEAVFQSSGHLESFVDPITQCTKCHATYRADKLFEDELGMEMPEGLDPDKFTALIKEHKLVCPKDGAELTEVKRFNLLMGIDIGATGKQKGYLRGEACQNIFLNFSRIYKTTKNNLPLGIAQAGGAYRNEISPRNGLLRTREIEQMDVELFFDPKFINEVENWEEVKDYKLRLMLLGSDQVKDVTCEDAVEKKIVSGKIVAYHLARLQQLYESMNVPVEKMRFRELESEERAFYAAETWDYEVLTDLGWVELTANNYRTDHDIKVHSEGSKKDLKVNSDGEKIYPHVWEISTGIGRSLYVVLENALKAEQKGDVSRDYLDLPMAIAPYDLGVYPLVKKDGLKELATEIFEELRDLGFDVLYSESASVGKRYARADEVGIKYNITIDFESKEDRTVTLRERNSTEQKRVKIDELPMLLLKLKGQKTSFKDL